MNNIEIKYAVISLENIERQLRDDPDCKFSNRVKQTDLYFNIPQGRLKLRQQQPENAELIYYERENVNHPRDSNYLIYATDQPDQLRAFLTAALGMTVTVIKNRSVWMFRNVRIHLDRVKGLGEFLELEAVVDDNHNRETSATNLEFVLHKLSDFSLTVVPQGYADLTSRKEEQNKNPQ